MHNTSFEVGSMVRWSGRKATVIEANADGSYRIELFESGMREQQQVNFVPERDLSAIVSAPAPVEPTEPPPVAPVVDAPTVTPSLASGFRTAPTSSRPK